MENLNAAYEAYLYATAENFETCVDPRAYIRAESRLLDAAITAGMSYEHPAPNEWAAAKIAHWLCN